MTRDLGQFDLIVVGGGVNGAGIARDAAGRGLSVLLCEKDDLAQGTSSRSGKLVHGGLRYLEYYEFRLVREALIEREVLLQRRPAHHLADALRPAALAGAASGLAGAARDCFSTIISAAASILPPTPQARSHAARRRAAPIRKTFRRAFEYSDCWVDDARLVVLNALDAVERGATGADPNRRFSTRAARAAHGAPSSATGAAGSVSRRPQRSSSTRPAHGSTTFSTERGSNAESRVRLVKGSHIVTRKFWDGRAGLPAAEQRQAGDLRQPLRGRLRPDRHHRHSVRRPAGGRRDRPRRDRLSSRGRQPLFHRSPQVAATSSTPFPASARSTTTRPRTRAR